MRVAPRHAVPVALAALAVSVALTGCGDESTGRTASGTSGVLIAAGTLGPRLYTPGCVLRPGEGGTLL